MLGTKDKTKMGAKLAAMSARNPGKVWLVAKAGVPAAKLGAKAFKPLARRRARKQAGRVSDAARTMAETVAPVALYVLELAEPPPKPKRKAPRVIAGVAIAGTAYLVVPPERRQKVLQLLPS